MVERGLRTRFGSKATEETGTEARFHPLGCIMRAGTIWTGETQQARFRRSLFGQSGSLQIRFDVDHDLDAVADHALVRRDAKITPVQGG